MKKIAPFVNRVAIIWGREIKADRAQMAVVPIIPFMKNRSKRFPNSPLNILAVPLMLRNHRATPAKANRRNLVYIGNDPIFRKKLRIRCPMMMKYAPNIAASKLQKHQLRRVCGQ